MLLLPMDVPAEIHRVDARAIRTGNSVVAHGPLVIMAHGLLAMAPERRDQFAIRSPLGDLTAADAEDILRSWNAPQSRLD